MRQLELTPRLLAVARLVPRGARFADVGTDHAYLPVWLIRQGIISSAIATDLRPGPLERARETLERFRLTGTVQLRLCDGLQGVRPGEVDTVAIAGMGGETIAEILSGAPWLKEMGVRLVLQPMSTQRELRLWLREHAFRIDFETVAEEDGTFYNVLLAVPGQMPPLTRGQEWAGLQDPENPLLGAYLGREIDRVRRVLSSLDRAKQSSGLRQRRLWLELLLRELEQEKKEWEQCQQ